ncbi:hypothetical protein NDU88_001687 [Pleurodeles waltl]|uniref:DUF4939 domain-containing protein n=1 Tax=Pleurodeles waltl TaxID=8319 RepID=A0AAV7P8Q1_PLEWA|nr:hypothetical protein NDU88_001687 [Pleurodeles waltl]
MQVMVTTPTPVPLALPERFFGDSAKFNIFLNQCQLQFLCHAAAFPNDAAKVAFIISYLGGNATNWSITQVERNDPILYDFNQFKEALWKLFAKHLFMQVSDNELLNLHQGNRDLLSYIASFHRLVAENEWPAEKRTSLFYRGLWDDLKDVLAQTVEPPTECSEFIDLVVRLDHHLSEHKPLLVTPLRCGSTHSKATKPDGTLAIPAPYEDFYDVFSEKKATQLPPHRLYDCCIDLIPGATLPCSRVYALSEPENRYLQDYQDDILAMGFICHTTSPVSSSLFFETKTNRELCAVNKVNIKNQYPLPLIPVLLGQVRQSTIYIKLNHRLPLDPSDEGG